MVATGSICIALGPPDCLIYNVRNGEKKFEVLGRSARKRKNRCGNVEFEGKLAYFFLRNRKNTAMSKEKRRTSERSTSD